MKDCGQSPECLIKRWKTFIANTAKLPRDKQLDAVNRWANAYAYIEDWAHWGLPDYWESPREFLAGGGDCEDYAIIKYFTLIQLGFSPSDMRIVVVNDTNLEIFHAVLAVRQPKEEPILLDNQAQNLVPMSAAPQYKTIYSLNENGWWMANAPSIMISKNNVANEFQTASGSAN
ncbi:MAG: transglutaminase-like cysteine peptidase [Parvibaculaceae bacterium]